MTDTDPDITEETRTVRTDGGTAPDGGVEELGIFGPGGQIEETTVSRGERLSRFVDRSIIAPFRVAWSDWRARVGGLLLLFYIAMGTVGVVIIDAPTMNAGEPFLQPLEKMKFPLGTDQMGQSIGRQIIHATPAMLKMAFAGVLFASGVAVLVGVLGGYKGGFVDRVLMTIVDIQIAIPGLPLIIVISSIYPPKDPFLVGVILSIDRWPGLARAIRSQVLTIREENFVESARSMGISTSHILTRDVVPQIMPYIAINSATAAGAVIAQSAGLYFLGILPFTTLNWGVMMNLARGSGNAIADPLYTGHWLFFPALALSGLIFALVLFSQGLDRVFNPRIRARHAETITGEGEDGEDEEGVTQVSTTQA